MVSVNSAQIPLESIIHQIIINITFFHPSSRQWFFFCIGEFSQLYWCLNHKFIWRWDHRSINIRLNKPEIASLKYKTDISNQWPFVCQFCTTEKVTRLDKLTCPSATSWNYSAFHDLGTSSFTANMHIAKDKANVINVVVFSYNMAELLILKATIKPKHSGAAVRCCFTAPETRVWSQL